MKKLLILSLTALLVFSASSCGKPNETSSTTETEPSKAASQAISAVGDASTASDETASTEESAVTGDGLLASFSTTDLNNNTVTQEVLAGKKLTMINVWGTYCGPCISEMGDLGELSRELSENFQIIGVLCNGLNMDGTPNASILQDANAIIDQTQADYLHVYPSESLNKAFLDNTTVVPTTFFVDAQGNSVGGVYLGSHTKADWEGIIESLLASIQ